MSSSNHRKCAKCGKTRAEDMTVTYHRFPYPGPSNVTKARAWAKYCWPNEDWTSLTFLQSLHTSSKVLCGRHFNLTQFYDNNRQKLSKFAVPDSTEVEELLNDQENIFRQTVKETETTQHISRRPLLQIGNIDPESPLAEPSTSTTVQKKIVQVESTGDIQSEPITRSTFESISTKQLSKQSSKKSRGILRDLNISKLSEMTSREIKLYNFCRKNLREILRLRNKLKNNKRDLITKLHDDQNVQKLGDLNISNSFLLLLQSQMKNCPKKPKGRRYSIEQKIMALVIYKKSPACYRLLRRMFALPCQSSLTKLLNKVPLKPGINKHIFNSLKKMSKNHTDEENLCILSFDEMSIRKHLYYNSKLDEIQGYQDHDNHGRSHLIATKAMVFMLTGLRKRWKQPIAFYFSQTLNSDRMTVILKEILSECINANMNVVATVCDMSTVNMKVLKTIGASAKEPFFNHQDREIITILDPPHLLKCTRNLLMKHDVICTTGVQCNDITQKGTVKWSHIEAFYKIDKNNPIFSYAPALTDSHLNPNAKQQMKVKLAAQVFSHCVAGGILARIALDELPAEAHATAYFVTKFDQLFDAVNADSPDCQKGKIYSTNLTARSPHLKLFAEMRRFISNMNYLRCKSNPPSQEGWIHTLNAIERLWKNMQHFEITSLSTRRLNQDPLENCFGCIRYNCGSNTNPTVPQFIAGIKTAIISNLRHSSLKKNCEDDVGVLCDNLRSFLTEIESQQEPELVLETELNFENIEILISDAVEAVEQATPEGQACGYVCGFIFKRLKNNHCLECRKAFLAKHIESIHLFTSFKEYDSSQSLNYINKNCIQCVESIAKITYNYLKDNSYKRAIKLNAVAAADCVDYTFLKECLEHFEVNVKHIKMCTFFICLKRFITQRNREMDEEEKKKSLERKIRILRNK